MVAETPRIELEPPHRPPAERPVAPRGRSAPRRAGPEPKRPVAERILRLLGPLGLSLLIHALVLTVFSFVTWAVSVSAAGTPGEFTAQLVQMPRSGPQGGFTFTGDAQADRPDSSEASDRIRDLASLLAEEGSLTMSAVDLGNAGLRDVPVQALQRSDVVGAQLFGGGDGRDSGSGLGEGSMAGGGPVGSLWGVGAGQRADTVVYVMDRSGSMSDTIGTLKRELKKAIGELSEDQKFNVIWFSDERPQAWAPELRSATIENKRSAFAAIEDVYSEGQTNPIPAIQMAMNSRPDVMFLLSDGDFSQQNEEVLKAIRDRNRKQRTIINTILFCFFSKSIADDERVLEIIARENRGTYKHVTEEETRRRY